MLSRFAEPRCPFRRLAVCRGHVNRDLLPAHLSGEDCKVRELPFLWFGSGGTGSGFSPLPALPAGNCARSGFLARNFEYGLASTGSNH